MRDGPEATGGLKNNILVINCGTGRSWCAVANDMAQVANPFSRGSDSLDNRDAEQVTQLPGIDRDVVAPRLIHQVEDQDNSASEFEQFERHRKHAAQTLCVHYVNHKVFLRSLEQNL